MTEVNVHPMPESYRPFKRFRPMPPPVFPDGAPSAADVRLALELIEALDAESRAWYAITERSLRQCLAEMQYA